MYSCKVFPPLLVTHRKLKRKVKNKPADGTHTHAHAHRCSVVYPSIRWEKSVVGKGGGSYLSLFCVTVLPYKFRIAAVMIKVFHGVINIWQIHGLFHISGGFFYRFVHPLLTRAFVSRCITGFCFYLARLYRRISQNSNPSLWVLLRNLPPPPW